MTELRARARVSQMEPAPMLCEEGCGCRYGTIDPDRLDCACDGPCSMAAHDVWYHGGGRCPGPACVTQGGASRG